MAPAPPVPSEPEQGQQSYWRLASIIKIIIMINSKNDSVEQRVGYSSVTDAPEEGKEPAPVAARSPPGRVDVTSPSGGFKWEKTL